MKDYGLSLNSRKASNSDDRMGKIHKGVIQHKHVLTVCPSVMIKCFCDQLPAFLSNLKTCASFYLIYTTHKGYYTSVDQRSSTFYAPQTGLCTTIFSQISLQGVTDKYNNIKPVPLPTKRRFIHKIYWQRGHFH